MNRRFFPGLAAALWLACAVPAVADDASDTRELKRIQSLLSLINGEIKSDLEQLQLLQEALKLNSRMGAGPDGQKPPTPEAYDAVVAARQKALQRETSINQRLDAILTRSAALDARKQQLLDRLLGQ